MNDRLDELVDRASAGDGEAVEELAHGKPRRPVAAASQAIAEGAPPALPLEEKRPEIVEEEVSWRIDEEDLTIAIPGFKFSFDESAARALKAFLNKNYPDGA